ncbi:TRAP transporter large permease subunit [Desulfobacter sp.]|uniref:TRAP transporter large permease subunit n=1 Tax=Desulfobacter sp. TaxID=2294 RepID=UPI003D0AC763
MLAHFKKRAYKTIVLCLVFWGLVFLAQGCGVKSNMMTALSRSILNNKEDFNALADMQIGYFTPPVGMNLFIAGYRFNKPIVEIYRATIPLILVVLLSVLIITYWPQLSLFMIS